MGNVSSGFYNSSNCASINFKGNHLVIDYRLVLALTNASLMSATPPLLNQIRRTNDRLAQISKKKREEKKTSLLAKFVHAVLRFEKIRENSFWKQIRRGAKMRHEIGIPRAKPGIFLPLVVVIIRGERGWETEMAGPITGWEGDNDDT